MQTKKTADQLIKEHLNDCQARLSLHTVKNHRVCLNAFTKFLGKEAITDATKSDVRRFLNDMKQRGRARSTLTGNYGILCSFFRYIEVYHGISMPSLDDIDIKAYPKGTWEGQKREALTKGEVRALIEAPDNLRDVLLIAMLYYLGLRVSEAAYLTTENVDTENRIVEVIGKGNKPRKIPYSSKLDRAISIWLHKERRSYTNANSSLYFFLSKHGEHLNPKSISNMVHNYAEKAGMQKVIGQRADGTKIYKVHPHILRHSFATHGAEDNIPLTLIQKMMGHSNLSTTIGYMGEQNGFKAYFDKFKGV